MCAGGMRAGREVLANEASGGAYGAAFPVPNNTRGKDYGQDTTARDTAAGRPSAQPRRDRIQRESEAAYKDAFREIEGARRESGEARPTSKRRLNMADNTTGKKTQRVPLRKKASADDPIYSRGFAIGTRHSATSSPATTSKESAPPPESSESSNNDGEKPTQE